MDGVMIFIKFGILMTIVIVRGVADLGYDF